MNCKKMISYIIIIGLLLIIPQTLADEAEENVGDVIITKSIMIGGDSDAVYDFVVAAAELFEDEYTNYSINVQKGGSDSVVKGAGLGLIDIGMTERYLSSEEYQNYPDFDQNGYKDASGEMDETLVAYYNTNPCMFITVDGFVDNHVQLFIDFCLDKDNNINICNTVGFDSIYNEGENDKLILTSSTSELIDDGNSLGLRCDLTIKNNDVENHDIVLKVESPTNFKPSIIECDNDWDYYELTGTVALDAGESKTLTFKPLITKIIPGTHKLKINAKFSDQDVQKTITIDYIVESSEDKPTDYSIEAMYVWYTTEILKEELGLSKEKLIEFCINPDYNINTIYLCVGDYEFDNHRLLYNLINDLNLDGIDVYALAPFNYVDWINPDGSYNDEMVYDWVDNVIEFNKYYTNGGDFTSMSIDIEFHRDYNVYAKDDTLIHFLDILKDIKNDIIDTGLLLGVDTRFPYDDYDWFFSYDGKYTNFAEHIMDITDFISIMAYMNNQAEITKITKGEVEYASKNNKNIIISLETQNSDDAYIKEINTYWTEGKGKIMLDHDKIGIWDEFIKEYDFKLDGFATHMYYSYKDLPYKIDSKPDDSGGIPATSTTPGFELIILLLSIMFIILLNQQKKKLGEK